MSDENAAAQIAANTQPEAAEPEAQENAGNNQETEGQEQEQQEAKPERFSRQHRVYQRQQAELRKAREEFDAQKREQEGKFEEQRKEYEQLRTWKEQLAKGEPHKFLRDNKVDLYTLQKLFLNEEQDPKTIAENVRKQIKEEYDSKFKQMEDQRKHQEQAAWQQRIDQKKQAALGAIDDLVKSNPEQYELCAAYPEAGQLILDVLWESYNANPQKACTYEQAAQGVENWIWEQEIQNNPLLKASKAKNLFLNAEKELGKKDDGKSSARSGEKRKHPSSGRQSTQQPRSVTSKMTHTTAPNARSADETPEERRARVRDAWRDGTWSPGMN